MKLNFNQWLNQLKFEAGKLYVKGFDPDPEIWIEYYNEGTTPQEAIKQDLQNG